MAEELNLKYRPTQHEVRARIRLALQEEQSRRQYAAVCLVLFFVIQPWHLFMALSELSKIETKYKFREGLYQPKMRPLFQVLMLGAFVAVAVTYGAITWGEAFSGSVLPGLTWFVLCWLIYDLVAITVNLDQELRRGRIREGRLLLSHFGRYLWRGFTDVELKTWTWLIIDIMLLSVIFYSLSYSERPTTFSQLAALRGAEGLVLTVVLASNLFMFALNLAEKKPRHEPRDRYIASLQSFAVLSDEDQADADAIVETLMSRTTRLSWLDIGSGNLEKVARIAQTLRTKHVHIDRIDCVEPHELWHSHERKHDDFPLKVHRVAWPAFASASAANRWNTITAIHSLYQFECTADGLVKHLDQIESCIRHPGVFLIVIEAPSSALLHAKQAVYEDIGATLVDERAIMRTAQRLSWPTPDRQELRQKFFTDTRGLSHPYDEFTEFPWFIFDTATSTNAEMEEGVVQRVSASLVQSLKQDTSNRTYLDVSDVVLIFDFKGNDGEHLVRSQ